MNPLQRFRQNYRIWAASRAAPRPIASISDGVWAHTQGRAEPIEGLATSVLTHERGVVCIAALYIKHHVIDAPVPYA